jgi:hypothetical protein
MENKVARKKSPSVGKLMHQGAEPKVGNQAESVKALMKQGTAKTFSGSGRRSVKSLMNQ